MMRIQKRPLLLAACALGVTALAGCKSPSSFGIADTNQDLKISQAEFDRYLLEAIYSEADADGDAKITFDEWRAANPDAKRSKYNVPDTNRDGSVTPAELKAYFEREGKLTDLFDKIDTDNNGHIDQAEADAFRDKMAAQAGSTKLQNLSRAATSK